MRNKSVHSCRFIYHAQFHCIMTRLNRLFKIEFERGKLEKSRNHIVMMFRRNIVALPRPSSNEHGWIIVGLERPFFFKLTWQRRPNPEANNLRLTNPWLSYKSSPGIFSARAIWTRNHMIIGRDLYHYRGATTKDTKTFFTQCLWNRKKS